jgi:predicted DNA-binding transcriptional regulator YafY
MSNLHRIKWIDERIRKKTYPNCTTIAGEFEISTRQALRDVEYLKYSLDAPLEYSPEKKGYYYSDDYYAIPAGFISQEEKHALSYLAYRYRNLGSENELKIAKLFDKLSGSKNSPGSDANSLKIIGVKSSQINNYDQIKHAIDNCIKIKAEYINGKEETSIRILHPYRLFIKNNFDYLEAFCELKNSIRIFRLDKIHLQKISGEKFKKAESFQPVDISSNNNFQFRKPFICRLKFKNNGNLAIENQFIKHVDNDIYEILYYNSGDFLKYLLSIGYSFTIIHPEWLRKKLTTKLNQILNENL